jgi:hypothetical protein
MGHDRTHDPPDQPGTRTPTMATINHYLRLTKHVLRLRTCRILQ